MATQDNTAKGLNWRGIFAIALTSIAHLVVFGVMLMPTKVPEPARRPPVVKAEGLQDWQPPPKPPKVVDEPKSRPEVVVKTPVVAPQIKQPVAHTVQEVVIAQPTEDAQEAHPVVADVAVAEEVSEARVDAGYRTNARIEYPSVLRKRRVEGDVLVRVLVGEDGRVVSVEIAKRSRHAAFDRSALRSVAQFKFNPKKVNGVAKSGYVLVPVNFRLDG